jgi:beta-glucosidase
MAFEEVGMGSESSSKDPDLRGLKLPSDFLFGVSNASYQVEGGYNRGAWPRNNWAQWERDGKVEDPGDTCRFWDRYSEHIELAASLGLNAFRLSLEWARIQPSTSETKTAPPPYDDKALDRYAEIVAAVQDAGMEPVVTMLHFTHPAWCGPDLWLDDGLVEAFVAFVAHSAREINGRLVQAGNRPIRLWVTLNEPNLLGLLAYVSGEHPHGKSGIAHARKAGENMMIAHVRAYNAVHDIYAETGWEKPEVSFNNYCMCFYTLDKAYFDLMRAPSRGISKDGLRDHFKAKQADWDRRFLELARTRWGGNSFQTLYYRFINKVYTALSNPAKITRAIDAVYASPRKDTVDFLGLDIYDPFTAAYAPKLPTPSRMRDKEPLLHTPLWENRYDPAEFGAVIRGYAQDAGGLPIYILENGMCHRQPRGASAVPRSDGLTREVFLRRMLGEVAICAREGVPVKAYSFWSLTDNYEWGSFEPRFGLHKYDFDAGKILENDGQGIPSGKVYAGLVADLKSSE